MLAHSLKQILDLVPEAYPLIKSASIEDDMPLDSKDSTIATALQLQYMEKIAKESIDVFALEKIARAVELFGVKDEVETLTKSMIKVAEERREEEINNSPENFLLKQSAFEGSLQNTDIGQRSEVATELYKQAMQLDITPSDEVILYSGNGYIIKEAACQALGIRAGITKNHDFIKIARAMIEHPEFENDIELVKQLADTVSTMDKQAGLHFKGHNFYKEAFVVKEAAYKSALMVKLAGKNVPYESIERVGREKIAAYMGEDIASEMDGGPANFAQVVETLPADLQSILSGLIRNV